LSWLAASLIPRAHIILCLAGIWSPGFVLDGERAKKVLHNLIAAHVQAYDTISPLDNTDADGDGVPKLVGFSHAMTFVKPAKFSVLGLL